MPLWGAAHQRHSRAIDIALGKVTQRMIVVPFVLEGVIKGVLTAVRLASDEPFDSGAK